MSAYEVPSSTAGRLKHHIVTRHRLDIGVRTLTLSRLSLINGVTDVGRNGSPCALHSGRRIGLPGTSVFPVNAVAHDWPHTVAVDCAVPRLGEGVPFPHPNILHQS